MITVRLISLNDSTTQSISREMMRKGGYSVSPLLLDTNTKPSSIWPSVRLGKSSSSFTEAPAISRNPLGSGSWKTGGIAQLQACLPAFYSPAALIWLFSPQSLAPHHPSASLPANCFSEGKKSDCLMRTSWLQDSSTTKQNLGHCFIMEMNHLYHWKRCYNTI